MWLCEKRHDANFAAQTVFTNEMAVDGFTLVIFKCQQLFKSRWGMLHIDWFKGLRYKKIDWFKGLRYKKIGILTLNIIEFLWYFTGGNNKFGNKVYDIIC